MKKKQLRCSVLSPSGLQFDFFSSASLRDEISSTFMIQTSVYDLRFRPVWRLEAHPVGVGMKV